MREAGRTPAFCCPSFPGDKSEPAIGEYGINGLFIGVPVKLGKGGIEEIIQLSPPCLSVKDFKCSL